MKLMWSWYGSNIVLVLTALFFGFVGIHTVLSLYFGVSTPIETEFDGMFAWFVAIVSWVTVLIGCPFLYYTHLFMDSKYKEKVKLSILDFNMHEFKNATIIVIDDFCYYLPKSPVGYDLKGLGYVVATNYYDRNKKFQSARLGFTHVKG